MSPHDGGGLAALRFPHRGPPLPATAQEIAPGVRWLRMPLPFALDHINLWLIADGAGWAIVDSGIHSAETKALWEQIFATGLDGKPVTRLICTHYHPDHVGLAGWLTERLGIELWMTDTEWRFGHERSHAIADGIHPSVAEMYRQAGLAEQTRATLGIARGSHYRSRVLPLPDRHRTLSDGMDLLLGGRTWRVVVGRGHAPEHACLFSPELDLFIAGDQVLPKISPNVSLWPADLDPDPLGSFLLSLKRLRQAVPPTSFVLPSHNLPFYGLHTRLDQLAALHAARLDQVVSACAEPHTVADLVPTLFTRALDRHQLGFAIGETLSHLVRAATAGRLRRHERADGVWLFERT
ncbi:MAG TPA: MBL fold metallo-hydrolase [Stellaceae bacterium]|nr:MBL fold metallo-hydrolase [Stellaceae bacterium]